MGCNKSKPVTKPAEAKKAEPEPKVEEKKSEPAKQEASAAEPAVQKADEQEVSEVIDVKKGLGVTNLKRGQSGHVLQHTATDVLVKYDDGKTEWTEIEDLKKMEKTLVEVAEKAPLPEVKFEGAGDNKGLCSCGFF